MADLWTDLLSCLDIEPASGNGESADTVTGYEARNQQLEYHRVFGGQILAQVISAAGLTCPDKSVKSLHTLFPHEGRADEPIRYEVHRRHEGRSFATLTMVTSQSKGVVATGRLDAHRRGRP